MQVVHLAAASGLRVEHILGILQLVHVEFVNVRGTDIAADIAAALKDKSQLKNKLLWRTSLFGVEADEYQRYQEEHALVLAVREDIIDDQDKRGVYD